MQHHDKVGYNFCNIPPTETFLEDIVSTNNLSAKQYEDLIQLLLNFLDQKYPLGDLNYILKQYSEEHNMEIVPLKRTFKNLLIIAREASRLKLSSGQLFSDLQKLGKTSENASKFCQMWKGQWNKIDSDTGDKHLETVQKLVDMEWKFGVTASSSEISRVGQCFVQLKFVTKKNASETDTVFVEMSLSQFYDFLHEMEKAKLKMDSLH